MSPPDLGRGTKTGEESERLQPSPFYLRNTCSPGRVAMKLKGNLIFNLWCRDGDTPDLALQVQDLHVVDLDGSQLLEACWGRGSCREV